LKSVLNLVKKNQKYINIELKPNNGHEISCVEKAFEEIKNINYEKIFFSSFDLSSCINLRENSPQSLCGFLNDSFNKINVKDTIDICKKYNFFSCGTNYNYFSKSIVDEFEKNNIKMTVYSDKNISANEAKNLWNNNVSSIFVDDPTNYSI
jgi:glycerophosphoryl diester phosphodiesterase